MARKRGKNVGHKGGRSARPDFQSARQATVFLPPNFLHPNRRNELFPSEHCLFNFGHFSLNFRACQYAVATIFPICAVAGAPVHARSCTRSCVFPAPPPIGTGTIQFTADNVKEPNQDMEGLPTTSNIDVKVSASFPSSEIFGIKLVNGVATQAILSFTNNEPEAVSVVFIGGSLWSDAFAQGPQLLRNLTTTRYNIEIPAGETDTLDYSFATEMLPQELKLNLASVITDSKGVPYTVMAFNETVSVVEPDTSIFDPQM